jgi:hypothetical protein
LNKKKNIMKKFLVLAVVLSVCSGTLWAQNHESVKARLKMAPGVVEVYEKPDAAEAVKKVESSSHHTKVKGYTILLFSDNSSVARENAFGAKAAFEKNFSDTKLQIFYESPTFYVTAGSYLTMEEAVVELNRFRQVFPKAIVQSREVDLSSFVKVEGLKQMGGIEEPHRDSLAEDGVTIIVDTTTIEVFKPLQ